MDKDEALREVQEIKQVIDESRKVPSFFEKNKFWVFAVIALIIMLTLFFGIYLTPFIGIVLIVIGVIVMRESTDPTTKAIAKGAVIIGIIALVLTAGILMFLWPVHSSSHTIVTSTVFPPN
jgi:uncharacterized membrane protein